MQRMINRFMVVASLVGLVASSAACARQEMDLAHQLHVRARIGEQLDELHLRIRARLTHWLATFGRTSRCAFALGGHRGWRRGAASPGIEKGPAAPAPPPE